MYLNTKLSLNEIRNIAKTRTNFIRGEDYFRRKKVTGVKLWKREGEEQLSASVQGNENAPYVTSICIGNSGDLIGYDCTCPAYHTNEQVCKHIVALLLYRFANKEMSSYRIMEGAAPI